MEDHREEIEESEESGLFEHYRITVDPGQSSVVSINFFLTELRMHLEADYRLLQMPAIFW